ncbi:hypothetical protein [Duganella sp. S19_KUP01_CR8]|uniref:hypothetical protein n=1 Tax=Duganella sp. S19_KUP01_CR8 TaxID=3025502 RepID=UPI002FCD79E6
MKSQFFGLFFNFLLLILPGSAVLAAENARLETRYGSIDTLSASDTTVVRYRGNAILTLEADWASLHRITTSAGHEYVVVRAWHPGLNCHYFFHLIDLAADGVVLVSKDFGECGELSGAGIVGKEPVVHLGSSVSYVWRNGEMTQLETADICASLALTVKTPAKKVQNLERFVTGEGRLQFFSAPSEACANKGVFVVPGDRLLTSLMHEDFVFVTYTNPKNGHRVDGWVTGGRLSSH